MSAYCTLNTEQVKLGFVASCVEFVATALNLPVERCYARMKKAHLLDEYLYQNYEAVHSQSREHVTEDLIHLLNRAEKGTQNGQSD